jgi:hypothetical protein
LLCVYVRSGLALAYGCRIPLFRRQGEHHILVGAPDHPFGVGGHSHVQLGVCCTCLVVSFAVRRGFEEWFELQSRRSRILPTDLVVGAFLGR